MKSLLRVCALLFMVGCGSAPPQRPTHAEVAQPAPAPPPPPTEEYFAVPISADDPTWGSRLALVTIVEFSDFQCPYCGKVKPTIDRLKAEYGPEKLRIVWKHEPLPFHPNARPAAEAAVGVFKSKGSEAFWKFHDLAFANQAQLSTENYEKWAAQAGVGDAAKFKTDLGSHAWADKVEKDHQLAKQLLVNGTPAFVINGVPLTGAQPFEKFKSLVDQEMKKAEERIASGTPREYVYAAMAQENQRAVPPPSPKDEDEVDDTTTVWKMPVGKSPVLGNPAALVTIVEFSDLQCPYCKRAQDTLKKVRDTYGDKVRIVWKHEPLPFHPRAEPAAQLAIEARAQKGDQGFWAAHDALFESAPNLDDADLASVAKKLGLNVAKVKAAIESHKYKKVIDDDQDLADDFQAAGTPHFFINGRRLVGAQPFEKFKGVIDEEITKANAQLAKGTKGTDLYDALVKDGKGVPEPEKKSIALPANGPVKGNPRAKVTILEISDFQCPFCKRANQVIDEVMKNYGTRVKLTWRHLPLPMHADAPLAAQAAQEAFAQKGSDGFWKMHTLLFENQGTADALKRPALVDYAKRIGLNVTKFDRALDDHTHEAAVKADAKVANDAGVNGTPAFIINGYYLNGAQPYAKFRKLIERALAEAK